MFGGQNFQIVEATLKNAHQARSMKLCCWHGFLKFFHRRSGPYVGLLELENRPDPFTDWMA